MQYSSYIPMHYRDGNLNGGLGSFSWPSNDRYRDERSFGGFPSLLSMDRCQGYDKSMMRWIMQKHESTFRFQVQELHRLYGRQKDLMEEMKLRQNFLRSRTSESLFGPNQSVSQEPSWLLRLHPQNQFSQPTMINALRSHSSAPESFQGHLFPASRTNGNMLDPELPLFLHHDQKGKHVVNSADPDCNGSRTEFPFDLNQPIQMESPISSSLSPCDPSEALIPGQPPFVYADDSNLVVDFDLNSEPKSMKDEPAAAYHGFSSFSGNLVDSKNSHRLSGATLEIDLNSTILIDEPSPDPLHSVVPTRDADLMCPISPENQEVSPPRCESEDIGHEFPVPSIDLDIITARTLVSISSTSATDKPGNAHDYLLWFAEIVSSSSGDDLKNDQRDGIHDSNRKRKSTAKEMSTIEVLDHRASPRMETTRDKAMKHSFSCKSWGKTGKREGGCRRRRRAVRT